MPAGTNSNSYQTCSYPYSNLCPHSYPLVLFGGVIGATGAGLLEAPYLLAFKIEKGGPSLIAVLGPLGPLPFDSWRWPLVEAYPVRICSGDDAASRVPDSLTLVPSYATGHGYSCGNRYQPTHLPPSAPFAVEPCASTTTTDWRSGNFLQ